MSARLVRRAAALLLVVLLSACSARPGGTPGVDDQPVSTPGATGGPTAAPVTPTVHTPGSRTLTIWVPPAFDPVAVTPAGVLLADRLAQFEAAHPGLTIEVRVKAEHGASGLLASLQAAALAAPQALPDLIALPQSDLQTAARTGLLHPYDGLTEAPDDPDWYGYARGLGRVQNSVFGLPFAGDALVLVYRPAALGPLEPDWDDVLTSGGALTFPAADPHAGLTLALYLSTGASPVDGQGLPALDPVALQRVLELYTALDRAGRLPSAAVSAVDEAAAWTLYVDGRADLAVVHAARVLSSGAFDGAALPLPGLDGAGYSLGTGWSWALAGQDAGDQVLAVELAVFLTEAAFQAAWTEAAGWLPTRPTALAGWTDAQSQALAAGAVQSAQPALSEEVGAVLAPLLARAVQDVLAGRADPATAAAAAVDGLP